MNKPIAVGDRAIAVLPALCCGSPTIGMNIPFKVVEIARYKAECVYCHHVYESVTVISGPCIENFGHDIRRCIRIDPPAVRESVSTELEVTV